jgi:cyclopropane fatty-acyl-phospholipid synthase-like methyltransferase
MTLKDDMERIYGEVPLEKIPWCLEDLPAPVEDLLRSGKLNPCKAVDLGCGAGAYTIELARRGFEMTGVDFSEKAVDLAKERAEKAGVECRFKVADLIREPVGGTFDLAFEWEVLHHVFPEDREAYLDNVRILLNPGGLYLSVCFSEKSPQFGGQGKLRKTPLGTELYHSSEEELRALFEPRFEILRLETIEVKGKYSPHMANLSLLRRGV